MKKVILIHGNGGGTGKDNWQPWVKAELETNGIRCVSPDFPDSDLARAVYWLPFLENELKVDQDTVLVGHSSGAIAALRFAENHKILGSVLVAPYHTDLGYDSEKQSGYFDKPFDWDAIRNNQKWTVIYASTDDPYIPIDQPRFIRDQLRAEYVEFTDQGHLGEDMGKSTFPELVAILNSKLGK